MNQLNDILINLTSNDPQIQKENEKIFLEFELEQPYEVLNLLFLNFQEVQNEKVLFISLLNIRRILNRLITQNKEFDLDFQFFIKNTIIQLLQTQLSDRCFNYLFYIIDILILPFSIRSEWPDIFNIMTNFIGTNKESNALKFFAIYAQSYPNDDFPNDLLLYFQQLFESEFLNESAKVSQIHLYFSILKLNPEYYSQFQKCVELILSLQTPLLIALSKFLDFFQLSEDLFLPVLDQLIFMFFDIIKSDKYLEGSKIAAIEIFEKMIEKSRNISDFISSNINYFVDSMIFIFSNPKDIEITDKFSLLFETSLLCIQSFINKSYQYKSDFENYCLTLINHESPYVSSTLLRLIHPISYINNIFEFSLVNDNLINSNSLEAFIKIFEENFEELTQNDEKILKQIFDLLIHFLQNQIENSTIALVLFCEKCSKEFLGTIAQDIINLISNIFIPDTIKCLAILSQHYPSDLIDISLSVTEKVLEILSSEISNNDLESLIYSLSLMFNSFNNEIQITIFESIIKIIEKVPELSYFDGTISMSSILGKKCIPYLDYLIPPLISKSRQKVDTGIDLESNWSELSDFHVIFVPSLNGKMIFRVEQFVEIQNSIDALKQYTISLGEDILPYTELLTNVLEEGLFFHFDVNVRISSFNLLNSLIITFPSTGIQFFPLFEALFISENWEIENIVRNSFLSSLTKFIESKEISKEFLQILISLIPKFILKLFEEIKSEINSNNFNNYIEDEYFDILWNILLLMKGFGSIIPNDTIPIFESLFILFNDYNEKEFNQSIERIKIGLISDFLENLTNYEKFDEYIQYIIHGMKDSDSAIRRIALYGIGHIYFKKQCKPQDLEPILLQLLTIINDENSRDDELTAGTDCAVSSYVLLLQKRMNNSGFEPYAEALSNLLPIEDDIDEVIVVFNFLLNNLNNKKIPSYILSSYMEIIIEFLEIDSLKNYLLKIINEKKNFLPKSLLNKL